MSLKHRTAKGISWTLASQITRLVTTFAVMAVLAHLLSPSDFGLMAMVAVFSNIFIILNDVGLSAAVIQKQDITEEHISSAFWLNLIEGVVISLLFMAIAPLIARFYNRSVLTPIVMVLSVMFTMSSLGMIQQALFAKRLNFKTIAVIEMVAVILAGVIAVALAASGFGVWSLVAQTLISTTVIAVLLFTVSSWKPKMMFRWKAVRGLFGYGLHLLGFNIVNYFSRNLDNLLIGKFLGATQLGFYSIAYRLLLFPLSNISQVLGRVLFPALSVIQEDKAAVRSAYQRANRYIASLTFPFMAGLAILAPQLVRVALGHKWERSIFLIQVLALVGLLQTIGATVGWLYMSQGKTKTYFRYGVAVAIVYASAFIIGLQWNVEGVAVAYAIAAVLIAYPSFAIPFRYIDLKFRNFARQFWTIALATAGMAAVTFGSRLLLEKVASIGDVPVLIIGVILGAASYAGLLLVLDMKLIQELLDVVRTMKATEEPEY